MCDEIGQCHLVDILTGIHVCIILYRPLSIWGKVTQVPGLNLLSQKEMLQLPEGQLG